EIFERPQQMHRSDAKHGGADAHAAIERHYMAIFQFFAQAIDHVNFRAHGPFRSGRRGFDHANDALGRADFVGGLRNFKFTFGMNDDPDGGIFSAYFGDLFGREALVHRAVALPQNDPRLGDGFR